MEDINKVSATPIDLSKITASTEIELDPDISGNIRLSASQPPIKAKITVRKKNNRSLSYSVDDIHLNDLPDRYSVTYDTQSVTIEISGTETALDKISTSDFTLSADCGNLQPGENTVTINVEMSENAIESKVSVTEPKMKLIIS